MLEALDVFRELNLPSVLLRLTLALVFGGLNGIDRTRKGRPAGVRTYMLVCMGAALTMLLSQYNHTLLTTRWAALGADMDVARYGAQVINGIGFLGAGSILVTGRQEVRGLTTAAGLWASGCMGLAIGAGFYECVILGFGLIFLCMRLLPYIEAEVVSRGRNMNLYAEFASPEDLHSLISRIREEGIEVREVDLQRPGGAKYRRCSGAVLTIHTHQRMSHIQLLTALADVERIYVLEEV